MSISQALAQGPLWVGAAGLGAVLWFQLVGWGLLQWWPRALQRPPVLLWMFFQQALGMAVAMVLLLVLAVAQVFIGWLVLCVGLGGALLLAWIGWRRQASALPAAGGAFRSWQDCLLRAGLLACAVLWVSMQAWRFPAAWDDTSYHLPLARTFVVQQGLVANEWLRFPYFPAFMQLLMAAGLWLDVGLAQWLATWPIAVTVLGLMGAAQWLCRHAGWGVLAGAVYLATPALRHVLGFAMPDGGMVLFCLAAVLVVAWWMDTEAAESGRLWLALAGAFAGLACGIKLQAVPLAATVGLGVLLWSSFRANRSRSPWSDVLAYGGCCVGVCGFWYLRSWWVTGDPIHPAGGAVFGYYLWNAEDLALQVTEQASHGVTKAWALLPQALWRAGVALLGGALVAPLLLRRPAWLLMAGIVWAGVIFWFWVSQVDRYVLAVVPLGALLCVELVRHCLPWVQARGGRNRLGVLLPAGLVLLGGVWLMAGAALELRQRPSIAAQRAAQEVIPLLEQAEAVAGTYGTTLLNLGYEYAVFYYRGQLVGDWFGRAAFPRIADCSDGCRMRSPEDTRRIMRMLGVRLLLVDTKKFPLDAQRYAARMHVLAQHGSGILYGLPAND
ncbi:MAG: hypothetical protein JSS01_10665 [Proteobacteria bacterium]|nr:hypothetical protein [Pseudomonadota bacterium]